MTPDAVEAVAQGRVWSGEEAKKNGLIDALGGYEVALRLAKKAALIPVGAPVELAVFPREEGVAEYLYKRLSGNEPEDSNGGVSAVGHAIQATGPLLQRLEALLDDTAILIMPPLSQPR
jgi:protease IV